MALLEERKRKLAAEGLFDQARKQLLPYMPQVIGVVTSPTGAVIRDILHRITDRFPLHVIVWPVRVQGETSGAEVAAAIAGFNALRAGRRDPAAGRDDRGARRRQPGGSVGLQRRGVVRAVAASDDSAHLGRRPRDRLDADRPCRRRARADADRRRRIRRAGEGRTGSDAGQPVGAAAAPACRSGFDRRRTALRAAARALPSPDQLLALPRRRFDEATSRLGARADRRRPSASGQG